MNSNEPAEGRPSTTQTNRRRHFRIDCDVSVTFRTAENGPSGTARLANLGLGGARVDFPEELPMPTDLWLSIPFGEATVSVKGRVIWTVMDESGGPVPTGVQFQRLDDATRRSLYDLIGTLES